MRQNSMKCQEVGDGETIISLIRNILVLATIATTATDPNKTNLRTADKANSGDKSQKLKDHIDPGVGPLCIHWTQQ